MEDNKVFIRILVQVSILTCQFKTKHTNQLPFWKSRVYHWSKHVEKCFHTKLLSYRRYILHRRMKQRGMHETNVCPIKASLQFINIICEFISKVFQQIRRSTCRRNSIVTVFGNRLSCSSNYE